MLISITEKCRMNCPHCMDDAKEDLTKFMSFDTWKKVVEFNDKYDPFMATITGGEPTEHPEFWDMLEYYVKRKTNESAITVVTNGMNLENDNTAKDKIDRINKINPLVTVFFQVTNVLGLYPIKLQTHKSVFHTKNVILCISMDDIAMYPMGRAIGKDYDFSKTKVTKCFNIRSAIRSTGSFILAVLLLRTKNKFCTPQIAYDGSIKLGESTLCPVASHINKSEKEIVQDIINFRCQGCKQVLDKIPSELKKNIGEE